VSPPPQWAYTQARLQARHGERLTDEGWHALTVARSFDEFLDRARAGSLSRFTQHLNTQMSVHALEATLRAELRVYVQELATWVLPQWRAAVLWAMLWPELPLIAAAIEGRAPDWLWQDGFYADLAEASPPSGSIFAPLAVTGPQDLAMRWLVHWRSLWPAGTDQKALEDLIALIGAHLADLNRAAPQDGSHTYRRALVQAVTRQFRRHSAGPVALFCHLLLVGEYLERLRGGLVRRCLFASAKVAA
jgi:hypothetical protein